MKAITLLQEIGLGHIILQTTEQFAFPLPIPWAACCLYVHYLLSGIAVFKQEHISPGNTVSMHWGVQGVIGKLSSFSYFLSDWSSGWQPCQAGAQGTSNTSHSMTLKPICQASWRNDQDDRVGCKRPVAKLSFFTARMKGSPFSKNPYLRAILGWLLQTHFIFLLSSGYRLSYVLQHQWQFTAISTAG